MRRYILNRTMMGLLTIFFVLVFVFVAARISGNPVEVMYPDGMEPGQLELYNTKYGLDKNYLEQFRLYIANMLQGDFGLSIVERRPVTQVILPRIGETFKLGIWALIASVLLGLILGICTALQQGSLLARFLNHSMSFIYAIPGFVLAILLMYLFSFHLNWLPSQGGTTAASYIMPVISLSLGPIIRIAKHVRTGIFDALSQDYIRTAVSKGVGKSRVIINHALRNALIPTITVIAMAFVGIIAGSTVIETVFSWPGIGQTLIRSVLNRDYPVIQFGIILLSTTIVVVTYFLDILYLVIDPRIGKGED